MTTLDLVKQNKVMPAIVIKLEKVGFDVIEATYNKVVVEANCLPVSISWEMCWCHGGRMWLSQSNTNINIELSSPEYDEKKGIVDPETELAFYIDNEMIDAVKSFEKYVYVVEVIGEYTKGKRKTSYFKSIEDASYFVFREDGHDLNSEYGQVIHQYPNPNMRERITYVNENNGVLTFRGQAIRDGKIDREYDIKFMIFRKK